jgi:hypothetical protein
MSGQVTPAGGIDAARTVAPAPAEGGRTTRQVVNKVWGATGGTAVGGAVATLVVWWLDANHVLTAGDLPETIKGAVATLVTTAFSFLGGYYTRPGSDEIVTRDAGGSPASGRP